MDLKVVGLFGGPNLLFPRIFEEVFGIKMVEEVVSRTIWS